MDELKYDIKRGADTYRTIWGGRLREWISSGKIKRGEIQVWRSGLSGWRKAEELDELAPFFKKQENGQTMKPAAKKKIRRLRSSAAVRRKIRNILIIDDEKDLCMLLSDILREKGYNVNNVNTRKNALTFLDKETPDMVILDLKLPDGDGMSVIPKIKKSSPKTVICITSAYGSEKKKEEARRKGVSFFIDKPFTTKDILKNIM